MTEEHDKSLAEVSAELVHDVLHDVPGAWDRLVERFEQLVLAIPRDLGLSSSDCEEVFQATWLSLYRNLKHLRRPGALVAWIITTTNREAWRVRRRDVRQRHEDLATADEDHPDGEIGPLGSSIELERRQMVHEALDELSERCRRLLTQLYFDESRSSYVDVAADLGVPVGSIGPTRGRCLAKLARLLERRGLP